MERNAVRPSRCSNPWESYPKKGREGVSLAEDKYYERLQEAWRAGRGDRSNQEIADAAGLAKSTVDYLFSVKSSDPKLSTAAAMSRELCTSMDRAFNVVSAEEKREETEIVLETKLRAAEREAERIGNTNIFLCVLVLAMAARIILFDLSCTDIGSFRGEWTFGAVLAMVCFSAAAVFAVCLAAHTAMRRWKK
nr:MAG TPA: Putative transcription regulator [Caudoviricetes sp.]